MKRREAMIKIAQLSAVGIGAVALSSCDSFFKPEEPTPDKYVTMNVGYARRNIGSSDCPIVDPNRDVYHWGYPGKGKLMQQVTSGVYQLRAENIKVNYPPERNNLEAYKTYVLDNAFFSETNHNCASRAYGLSYNGIPAPDDQVHKEEGGRQFVLHRVDENGNVYYY